MTPDWAEHAGTIVFVLIAFSASLIALICWFVRREFARFDVSLNYICSTIDKKADKSETDNLWQRVNTHGHKIDCDGEECKPKTTAVIIHEDA